MAPFYGWWSVANIVSLQFLSLGYFLSPNFHPPTTDWDVTWRKTANFQWFSDFFQDTLNRALNHELQQQFVRQYWHMTWQNIHQTSSAFFSCVYFKNIHTYCYCKTMKNSPLFNYEIWFQDLNKTFNCNYLRNVKVLVMGCDIAAPEPSYL